ncbi:MAG: sugar transferase [Clostridia bacterium]|nr:sugar transferase [Clostridia bacterium]
MPTDDIAQDEDIHCADTAPSETDKDIPLPIIDYAKIVRRKLLTRFFKRTFDIIISALSLLLLLPIFVIIAIAIKCSSKGYVYFRQERVGKGGKPFKIFKFRTMVSDAESKGLQITVGADARITKVGKFLRKTKIDELPQLINVLVGSMSLVGPRPEVPKYVNMYDDVQRNVLLVRPGITELASIVYRNENELLAKSDNPEETYINEIMPEKIRLNLEYIKKMNVFYDLILIIKTVGAILR